jgi:hypothetical protein
MVAAVLSASGQTRGVVSFTGVQLFWTMANKLAGGEEPTAADWDRLFASPGYAALEAHERRRAALTTAFRAAYSPFRRVERDSLLRLDSAALARRYEDREWRAYLYAYRASYDSAPATLRGVDALLAHLAGDRSRMLAVSDSLVRSLALEGRPVGMYVTRTIRRVLGDRRLAAVIGDPVAYMKTYQDAARKPGCGCPALSDATLLVLSALEVVPGTVPDSIPRRLREHSRGR